MAEQRGLVRIHVDAASQYGWLSGESFSDYTRRRATYSKDTVAIDPFRTPGVARSGFGVSGSPVSGFGGNQIVALRRYGTRARVMYGFDWRSNIWNIDAANDNASVVSALNASVITNQSRGFDIHDDSIFAAFNVNATIAYLSKYGPLSGTPTLNLSFNVSLLAYAPGTLDSPVTGTIQIKQVVLSWKGNVYAMHGNLIWYTAGTSGSLTTGATLPKQKIIKTAVGFRNQIAIGASDVTGSQVYPGNPKVYLYDGFSQDYQKEVPFPDFDIMNLEFDGDDLIGWGPTGMFIYNGDGFIRKDDVNRNLFHGATDVVKGSVYFAGDSGNGARAYGRPSDQLDKAFYKPFTGIGAEAVIRWVDATKIYVADVNGGIARFLSSANETSAKLVSSFIEMADGSKFYLRWMRVSYQALASGDSLSVYFQDESGNSYKVGSVTYAADSANNPYSKEFPENSFVGALPLMQKGKYELQFDGGSVKVTSLDFLFEKSQEI